MTLLAQTPPRFDGEPVVIGGVTYIVPALNFKALKALMETIQGIGLTADGSATDPLARFDKIFAVCHSALVRNYPDMTLASVEELLDLGSGMEVFRAVVRRSALVAVTEKNGLAVVSHSTGDMSTADSPPPSGGAGSTSTSA